MGKTLIRWLFRAVAYACYIVVVTIFLLWYLFPSEDVRSWLNGRLNSLYPAVSWQIEQLAFRLPARIVASGMSLRILETTGNAVRIEQASFDLDPWQLLQAGTLAGTYRLALQSGTVDGMFHFVPETYHLEADGTVKELNIQHLQALLNQVERKISGNLSGTITFQGNLRHPRAGNAEGDFVCREGEVEFHEPVLGLSTMPYTEISGQGSLREEQLYLREGRLDSPFLAGEFSGTILPAVDLRMSGLKFAGELTPRPELFAGITDDLIKTLLRSQLEDGKLPFTVTGTLREPGILFRGLSVEIDPAVRKGI